jgi:outer membrane protein OmpA-like peptidoglycan-associated protein
MAHIMRLSLHPVLVGTLFLAASAPGCASGPVPEAKSVVAEAPPQPPAVLVVRAAAAQHTNDAKEQIKAAAATTDTAERVSRLRRASDGLVLATTEWEDVSRRAEKPADVYEARFWAADARYQRVSIQSMLHSLQPAVSPDPSAEDLELARAAAVAARDSHEGSQYLEAAAFFAVHVADIARDIAWQHWVDTRAAAGVERRMHVRFDGADPATRTVRRDPVPPEVQASIAARDEFVKLVPPALDVRHRAIEYQWYGAETLFAYGHFDEARRRYEPLYKDRCGKDEYGYKAWEKLISMSNFTRDAERSRGLANAEKVRSCAVNDDQKRAAELMVVPTIQAAFYQDAAAALLQAEVGSPGQATDALWREAATRYEAALLAAPGSDAAPEAAINGAYAYRQVGEARKAITLYQTFTREFGAEGRLTALQQGDAVSRPDPDKYRMRLVYLRQAYEALAATLDGLSDPQGAASAYTKIAASTRFDRSARKNAAMELMHRFSLLGQRDKVTGGYRTLVSLEPSPEEKTHADLLVADYDHAQWRASAPDTGANREHRRAAEAALHDFCLAHRGDLASSRDALQAAYWVFTMKKTAADPDIRSAATATVTAWENLRAHGDGAALEPPLSDYRAEAQFATVDEQIRKEYDPETGHHRYAGTVEEIIGVAGKRSATKDGAFTRNATLALKYIVLLDGVKAGASVEWEVAALARQGTVYDALRTGLYDALPPAVHYFSPEQEAILRRLETSGVATLQQQADDMRTTVKDTWRNEKEAALDQADARMVSSYVTALALARAHGARGRWVNRAIERLAYFSDILGDAKMREYVTHTKDPTDLTGARYVEYSDGMFKVAPGALGSAAPQPSTTGGTAPSFPSVSVPARPLVATGGVRLRGNEVFMPGQFQFHLATPTLIEGSESSRQVTTELVAFLQANPQITKLQVHGHTDSSGREDENVTLSQQRAEAVVAVLVAAGIDAGRLTAKGFGSSVNYRDADGNEYLNDTTFHRSMNRRIGFRILQLGGQDWAGPP